MQQADEHAITNECVSQSVAENADEISQIENRLHDGVSLEGAPEPQQNASEVPDSHSITQRQDADVEEKKNASVLSEEDTSEIVPTVETIFFETGNPDTRATTSGALEIGRVTGNLLTILVESVPGLMTSPDFCMFVRPFSDAILHFRPLRLKTERNRYIVILRFKEASDASNFAQVYQGKHFLQGLVQETCHVHEVRSITFDRVNDEETTGFPSSAMFPREGEDALRAACAVCLEPLDAKNAALATTFCNHTMHAECLSKWDLNRCPVCRHTHELAPEASVCMGCNHRDDLWMCAVCAFVGCGVYTNKHAHSHFNETQHPFAINLEDRTFWGGETLRAGAVWDYISERFVNRLLTSEDGKVVEVSRDPARSSAASSRAIPDAACCSSENLGIVEDEENDRGLQAAVYASRMDAMVGEYQARLERMEAERVAEKEQLESEVNRLNEALAKGTKEKKNLQKRICEVEKEARGLQDKNKFLKNLSEQLLGDNRGWNEQVEKLKKQLTETQEAKKGLEEQIRDLMMHIDAQAKIAGASEACRSGPSELHGADVLRVGPSPRERLAMKTHRR